MLKFLENRSAEWSRIYDALLITTAFLLVCWALWLFQTQLGYPINRWGLRPRDPRGLVGIGTMHFLHNTRDITHILNNTLSFTVLNTMLFYFYRKVGWKVLLWTMFAGAALLWLWGRPSNHIGASLVIFGIAGFLFFSGIFRTDQQSMRISLLTAFWYGGIVWGIFPIDPTKSWEGHASGLAIGILMALLLRKQGPQRKKYQWEIDEELEAEEDERLGISDAEILEEYTSPPESHHTSDQSDEVPVHYVITPKKKTEQGND
ncbi:MAG: rhomboid family intramembrane serine protease [Flavobacteriales bacterium]